MENFQQKQNVSSEKESPLLNPQGEDIGLKIKEIIDTADTDGYVRASEIFSLMGMQAQYGSYYFRDIAGYPNLGIGLHYKKDDGGNYHQDKILKEEVITLVRKLSDHLRKQ